MTSAWKWFHVTDEKRHKDKPLKQLDNHMSVSASQHANQHLTTLQLTWTAAWSLAILQTYEQICCSGWAFILCSWRSILHVLLWTRKCCRKLIFLLSINHLMNNYCSLTNPQLVTSPKNNFEDTSSVSLQSLSFDCCNFSRFLSDSRHKIDSVKSPSHFQTWPRTLSACLILKAVEHVAH